MAQPAPAPSLHADRSPEAVIEVEHLSKRYSAEVLAVDDLDFAVNRGEVCGLLGPNGAGKTTTLRMLVGLIRPTGGATRLFGTEVRPSSPVLGRVGTMIEHAAFIPYLPGIVNLRLYWEAGAGDFDNANLDEALAIAGLGNAVNRKVKTYSQGMRQRLGIARALLGSPEVLILDEPTNGLDPGEMRDVRELLRRLADRGVTVLLSSHLLSEVEQVCSHAVVMDKGRLIATGEVAQLVQASTSAYVEVDDNAKAEQVIRALPGIRNVRPEHPGLAVDLDGARRSDVVAALVHAGIAVDTVQSRHRLEDAFLGLLDEEN